MNFIRLAKKPRKRSTFAAWRHQSKIGVRGRGGKFPLRSVLATERDPGGTAIAPRMLQRGVPRSHGLCAARAAGKTGRINKLGAVVKRARRRPSREKVIRRATPGALSFKTMHVATLRCLVLFAMVLAQGRAAHAADAGQTPSLPSLNNYAARYFRDAYGLGDSSVRAIAQGRDGYLWIGTDAGLARFDGARFTVFDASKSPILHRHRVRALVADGDGGIWMGMPEGEGLIRHTGGAFESWRDRIKFFLGASVLSLLRTHDGSLWMGSWKSIMRLPQGAVGSSEVFSNENGLPLGDVWALAEGQDGEVWAGSGGTVLQIKGSTIKRIALPSLRRPLVRALALQNESGIAWIGTESGLIRLQGPESVVLGVADGLPSDEILSLLLDSKGQLWVGTAAGLARLGTKGFETSNGKRELPSDPVTALFEDGQNDIWLGFRTGGVTRLTVPQIGRIGKEEGLLSDRPTSLLMARNGDLWIGSAGDGLIRWPKWRQATQISLPVGPAKPMPPIASADACPPHVTSLLEDNEGRLWVGGQGSAEANLCMRPREDAPFRPIRTADGLPDGTPVHVLYQSSDGTVWIGAENLHRVKDQSLVVEPVPRAFPGWGGVKAMHEDGAHRLWVATGFIVWYREGGIWASLGNGPPTLDRPLEHPVRAFADGADGSLWIGHGRGLAHIVGGIAQTFGASMGLLSDPVTGLVNLGKNGLWLATAGGIFRVDVAAIGDVITGRATGLLPRRFGVDEGMRTARCAAEGSQTVIQDPAGRLWFSTGRGLVILDPGHLRPPSAAPKALIERVLVDGVPVPVPSAQNTTAPPVFQIPAGTRSVRIEFTAVAFRAPEGLRFHHRLDPLDRRWSQPAEDRSVIFADIPAGRYTFSVAATGVDGQFGIPTNPIGLVVDPHMIETWWFRSLVLLAVVAALIGTHRLRTSQLRARHAGILGERMRIAREIHDTLAQGFTGISLQLEAATRRLKVPSTDPRGGTAVIQENLDKARLLVRMSLADARRAVMDLRDPASDTDLGQALREHAARQNGTPPLHVSVSGQVRRLPLLHEQALLRIAQEATTNAVRYAKATRIDIALTFGSNLVELRVSDDGVGFVPHSPNPAQDGTDEAPKGFGLMGMNERARDLKGTVEIQSRPGEGTQVVARIPVQTVQER